MTTTAAMRETMRRAEIEPGTLMLAEVSAGELPRMLPAAGSPQANRGEA